VALLASAASSPAAFAAAKAPAKTAKRPVQTAPKSTAKLSGAMAQGVLYYNKGWFQKAVPAFRQAVAKDPNSEQAYLWLARAAKRQGGPSYFLESQNAYQHVLSINPDNLEALLTLGEILSWQPEQRQNAIRMYRRALQQKPGDPAIIKPLVQVMVWEQQYDQALLIAEPVADKFQADKTWMSLYAGLLTHARRFADAVPLYENQLSAKTTEQLNVKMGYTIALAGLGRETEAREQYQTLKNRLNAKPAEITVAHRLAMGGLAYDLGDYDESLSWDQSLPANSLQANVPIRLRIARALAKVGRGPEAIDTFYKLYTEGKLNTAEQLEFADTMAQLKIASDAMPQPGLLEKIYRDAMAAEPENSQIPLRLAHAYIQQDKPFQDVIQVFQQAIDMNTMSETPRQETVDYLKANYKANPSEVDAAFKSLLGKYPGDATLALGYADVLSWESDRRTEALKIAVDALSKNPGRQEAAEAVIDQILSWHEPSLTLVPQYQQILTLLPNNRMALLSMARAYRDSKQKYGEALQIFQMLMSEHPDDPLIRREWTALLMSAQDNKRKEALKALETATKNNPDDIDAWVAYAKLLSYDRQYGRSVQVFNQVLAKASDNVEAIAGKGQAMLWGGQRFAAQKFLSQMHKQYPNDVDITLALAETEKSIGRYDKALALIRSMKQQVNVAPVRLQEEDTSGKPAKSSFKGLDPRVYLGLQPQYAQSKTARLVAVSEPVSSASPNKLQSDLDILDRTLESLKVLQQQTNRDLDTLESNVGRIQQTVPTVESVQPIRANSGQPSSSFASMMMRSGQTGSSLLSPQPATYAQDAVLDGRGADLLAGKARAHQADMQRLEDSVEYALRPSLRGGFMYSTQKGDETTNALRSYGFPNQLSFSLTPQLRVRGGITPRKYYLPTDILLKDNRESWALQYSVGATAKYFDRLTLDGDIALTNYTAINDTDLTYQARAIIDATDKIKVSVGARRVPIELSMMSMVGQRPILPSERTGILYGQVRENEFFADISTGPWKGFDWNLGYSWAFVNGENIPDNYKNQAYTSLGYTWRFAEHHSMRVGYEFLYFGYSKDATEGFVDLTTFNNGAGGRLLPVSTFRARNIAVDATDGTVLGGYYSPRWFTLNSLRLDLMGSTPNKFLEYKLGGSVGLQASDRRVAAASPAAAAWSFDSTLTMNVTNWLALYGNVDFLDAGGLYQRWRFGGGMIVRPDIPAISPVFGKK
jgi:tetratricopeptide (TPR) repeat protein